MFFMFLCLIYYTYRNDIVYFAFGGCFIRYGWRLMGVDGHMIQYRYLVEGYIALKVGLIRFIVT